MLEFMMALTSVLLIAASQLLFKSAARQTTGQGAGATLLHPMVFGGLMVNFIAALCWIIALRNLEISYVFPLLSLNHLLVPLAAGYFFGERLSTRRWWAIATIVVGVAVCLVGGR